MLGLSMTLLFASNNSSSSAKIYTEATEQNTKVFEDFFLENGSSDEDDEVVESVILNYRVDENFLIAGITAIGRSLEDFDHGMSDTRKTSDVLLDATDDAHHPINTNKADESSNVNTSLNLATDIENNLIILTHNHNGSMKLILQDSEAPTYDLQGSTENKLTTDQEVLYARQEIIENLNHSQNNNDVQSNTTLTNNEIYSFDMIIKPEEILKEYIASSIKNDIILSKLAPTDRFAQTISNLPFPVTNNITQFQQVSGQLLVSIRSTRDGITELILDPNKLGRIKLRLDCVDNIMSVMISVESSETGDFMRRHLDGLAQEFKELGYENVKFSFSDDAHFEHEYAENDLAIRDCDVDIEQLEQLDHPLLISSAALDLRL